jgi:cell division protein FtsL
MPPTVQVPSERPPAAGVKERRLLYNGESSTTTGTNGSTSGASLFSRRRSSTFNTMAALFLAAVAIILYISNIIAVNRLAVEVNDLQQKYEAVMNSNEILRAEVNRRSSPERIGKIAVEQLGLQYPKQQPQVLDVDGQLLKNQ